MTASEVERVGKHHHFKLQRLQPLDQMKVVVDNLFRICDTKFTLAQVRNFEHDTNITAVSRLCPQLATTGQGINTSQRVDTTNAETRSRATRSFGPP